MFVGQIGPEPEKWPQCIEEDACGQRATVSYAADRPTATEAADPPESVSQQYFKDFKKQCVNAPNGLKPDIIEPLKVHKIKKCYIYYPIFLKTFGNLSKIGEDWDFQILFFSLKGYTLKVKTFFTVFLDVLPRSV